MSNNETNGKDFVIGAVIGGVLGTTAALLLAPKSGKRLRRDIYDAYEDFTDKTEEVAHQVSRKGRALARSVAGQQEEWTESAKDMAGCVCDYMSEPNNSFLVGSAVGGLVGAAAGLLLAPKPGKELRKDIVDTYHDVSDKAQEMATTVKKKGKSFAKEATHQANDWIEKAKDIVEILTEQAGELKDSAVEGMGETAERYCNRVNQAMEWAHLGLRLWQGIKNRR